MQKTKRYFFQLNFLTLLVITASFGPLFADDHKKWDELPTVEEWNDEQKTDCVHQEINRVLAASKEFSDLAAEKENIQYHRFRDYYSFTVMDNFENPFSGWLYIKFHEKTAYNKRTGESKVLDRSCGLNYGEVYYRWPVFELKNKPGEVIYSLKGLSGSWFWN